MLYRQAFSISINYLI